MSDLKPNVTKITLGDNEYGMAFNLNVIDDIQEHFDIAVEDIGKLFEDDKARLKNIKYLIALMVNEYAEAESEITGAKATKIDERFVGRRLNINTATTAIGKVLECINGGFPKSEDDESPNAQSE